MQLTRMPLGGQFLAQRFGEADHAGLGGGIGRRLGIAFLAGHRGDVDDAAIALRQHQRHDLAAAIERAVQVDVDHLKPAVQGKFLNRHRRAGDAGAIDQDVDLAQRVPALPGRLRDLLVVADIDTHGHGTSPSMSWRFSSGGGIEIPERDPAAFLTDPLGGQQPKPGCAAGDDGGAAGKTARKNTAFMLLLLGRGGRRFGPLGRLGASRAGLQADAGRMTRACFGAMRQNAPCSKLPTIHPRRGTPPLGGGVIRKSDQNCLRRLNTVYRPKVEPDATI